MNERTKYIDTRFGGNAADSLLQSEIDALDGSIKAEEERAKKEEKRLDEKIDAETERAVSEEQRIEGRLDEEIERAESEEQRIETKLDGEIERSIAEDERLDQKIDDETARAQEAERVLDEKIDTETERAEAAEEALDRKIDKEIEDRIADVDAEEASRIAADEALDQKIDQEIQDRIADVDAEEAARIAADEAEAQAREEADTEEAAARVLGDERLQDQIDTIEARSDVVDVVACYDRDDYEEPKPETDLVHYDTSVLSDNDVVKVLLDETHDHSVSYYRWVITSASGEPTEGEWVFIGSVEAYYTKSETDAIVSELQEQIDKDIEVVEYQTTTPLTDEQMAKAQAGRLAIWNSGAKVMLFRLYTSPNKLTFKGWTNYSPAQNGTYFPKVVVDTYLQLHLDLTTKLMSTCDSFSGRTVQDDSRNVLGANQTPVDGGSEIIRARNLHKTQDMMAPVYDSTATYAEGDYVIYQNDFYKCVSAITVAEAWTPAHWAKSSLSEMLDDIHTATELEILRLFREECTITSNITNGSASGDSTVWTEETASVTIAADSGYNLPETITVVGASYTYDSTTGIIALSDATGNVTITATCPTHVEMPNKGDIITLDNGTARYRVLKMNGNVAEVLALDNIADSRFRMGSVTTTFSDGSVGQKYENSTLDTYMNSTFYNSLSINIKNAIVQKAVTQSIYQYGLLEISGYDFAINRVDSKTCWYKRKGQVSVGNRYCYALDLDDVAEYLGAGSGNTISGTDLNGMFEQTIGTHKYIWLDSASLAISDNVLFFNGGFCYVAASSYSNSYVVRPAFQVDLTNLAWAKESNGPEKGDIITLDGGTARYRVLKTDGNIVEVLALDDVANSMFNNRSVTTTFSDGSTGQKYENSYLDNYMNSTFYNSLSANIKNAIVQKAITQSIYQLGSSEISGYDFAMTRITSGTRWYKRKGQVSVGNRYCYALDLDDVAEYLGAGSGNTVSGADLNDMFFEQIASINKDVWLDSAGSDYSGYAFCVGGYNGYVYDDSCDNPSIARPAFKVDISKLTWAKEE